MISTELLHKNLAIIADVQKRADCKIILALKGFAAHATFPVIKEYLPGTTASSVNEARLGFDESGCEVHICTCLLLNKDRHHSFIIKQGQASFIHSLFDIFTLKTNITFRTEVPSYFLIIFL